MAKAHLTREQLPFFIYRYTLQGSKFPRGRLESLILKSFTRELTGNLNREYYISYVVVGIELKNR